jgi:hypothetical protein
MTPPTNFALHVWVWHGKFPSNGCFHQLTQLLRVYHRNQPKQSTLGQSTGFWWALCAPVPQFSILAHSCSHSQVAGLCPINRVWAADFLVYSPLTSVFSKPHTLHPSRPLSMNLSSNHNQFPGSTLIFHMVTQPVQKPLGVRGRKMQGFLLFLDKRLDYKSSTKMIPLHNNSDPARKSRPILWCLLAKLKGDLFFLNFYRVSGCASMEFSLSLLFSFDCGHSRWRQFSPFPTVLLITLC